ncbi:MAG: hypothetical protein WCV90_00110 [Candidatus Woesearchaeota archaeon]|jgi:hypothetical protein
MKKEVKKYIDNFWKYYIDGAYVYTYLPKSYPKGMLTKKDQETIWKEIGQVNSMFNQGIEFKSDPNNKQFILNLEHLINLIKTPRLKQKLFSLRTDLVQIKLRLSDDVFKSNQMWALGPLNYFKKQLKQRIPKLDKEITINDVDEALLPLRPFLVGKTTFAVYVKKLNKDSEIKIN